MRPVDPRLLKYASAARVFFAVGGVLALLQTAVVVAFSLLVTQLIVQAIAGASVAALAPLLAGLAGVVVLRFVLSWGSEVNSARGAAVVKSELRGRVLDAVTRLGPAWLGARNSTSVGVTVGPGLDALDTYFAKYLPQLVLTAIATPVLVLVIWSQDWISGLTVAVTLPLIPVFMILIGWATQSVQSKQWEKLGRLSTAFLDVVGGLATLKIFGRQHRQAARIRSVTDDYRSQTMKVLRVSFLSGFALELAASLSVALVAVSIGVRLIDGSLGLSVGLFVLLLAPEAFLPVRNVGAQFHAAADGVAAADDVFAILDAGDASAPAVGSSVPFSPSPPTSAGGVEVRGLGVRYGESVAFAALDARFPAGEVTAVTGASGSGKSSLVAALLGYVPASGEILVDGRAANADPVPRPWLSWAGQGAVLLPGTVAENVALGDPAPDEYLARDALDVVGGESIALATAVDPRGGGLSGGQAQRVAAARAVYRARRFDCAVVVFDEPTSALDESTEAAVIQALRSLADEGRAVVVVSHRPAVIAAADHEVLLDASRPGTHVSVSAPASRPVSSPPASEPASAATVAEPTVDGVGEQPGHPAVRS
ncbi:thiol reductant ABC exporter subunit CydD [Herbiconiux ginsengi]|uniref:ATP-binding cassette, subfamily C, CydD n=1 Tax=Herbiconiux ginsengi TaxID=381665 RepID=A0A1H3T0I7_9MICO|nr:thiol reductant ABC exporter subunit CydD [Herbiconiux ginsengi]SDZ43873.1 ATP-binding cassette, subfamily C, CydD [Herbiconiux ginsengi]